MELVGVDDEFGWGTYAFEGLVHLLAALDGDVEVLFATHEERRGFNTVGVEEGIGEFNVGIEVLPRGAEFVVVLQNILVDAVEAEKIAHSGAAGGCFEACGAGDHIVGEDAAVAPAADAHAVCVDLAGGDGGVYCGLQVKDFLVAPVGVDGFAVGVAATGASTIVDVEDSITVCGE